ncbi:MAG: cysteine--tRNA ligase [Candidatus Omnitrophica bacterium]|nr:cysteine--tRNA ligase [Candidatus Omnitrophota bacterium]
MALRLYNTLSRRLEEFQPLKPPHVGMYVCGPTVYDEPHLGHARSAYAFDVIRRYLKHSQHEVTFVRNITDVDDKIIEAARAAGSTPQAIAERYTRSYHDMTRLLGCTPPDREPKATEYIPKMIAFIEGLIKRDAAYAAGGSVYFDVAKHRDYGKLSHRSTDELQTSERGETGEGKRAALDFALWKASKPGEPSWEGPWGPGRPGWHVECSTMSTALLGQTFDIHGGGLDLIFPHHENEIAQSEALAGEPFARYWLHHGLLTTNGQKMSKSLKNFVTVQDALAQCPHPDCLKIFFLKTHYRSPIDYSAERFNEAIENWKEFDRFFQLCQQALAHLPSGETDADLLDIYKRRESFDEAMDDDFNSPRALAVLFDLVDLGQNIIETGGKLHIASNLYKVLAECGKTLGLFEAGTAETDPNELRRVDALIEQRNRARKEKKFDVADQVRLQAMEQGYLMVDSAGKTYRVKIR